MKNFLTLLRAEGGIFLREANLAKPETPGCPEKCRFQCRPGAHSVRLDGHPSHLIKCLITGQAEASTFNMVDQYVNVNGPIDKTATNCVPPRRICCLRGARIRLRDPINSKLELIEAPSVRTLLPTNNQRRTVFPETLGRTCRSR